jgi:hypothetical protein
MARKRGDDWLASEREREGSSCPGVSQTETPDSVTYGPWCSPFPMLGFSLLTQMYDVQVGAVVCNPQARIYRMRCSRCGRKAAEVVAVARPRPRGVPKNPH